MIKITTRTILKNLIYNTIKEWQTKLPDKKLEEYDNWKDAIIEGLEYQLKKRNISLDEIIVDETEKGEESNGV